MAMPLRRSMLYIPSSSSKMLQKSLTLSPDTLVYDLEDSVASSQKLKARMELGKFLGLSLPKNNLQNGSDSTYKAPEISVRVNAVGTPQFEGDLQTALSLPQVRTLVLPKVHNVNDLDKVGEAITEVVRSSGLSPQGSAHKSAIDLVASIESAQALWNIGEIAQWRMGHARVAALLFAAEDFCADTSIIRTKSRSELLYARSRIVHAAKTFGLQAIDMVCVRYQDPEYLREECEDGRRLGFTGKQAIHPSQTQVIQDAFSPSTKDIERAAAIIQQMHSANASAKGAYGLATEDGSIKDVEMIDEPMVKQALNVLRQASQVGIAATSLAR